MGGRGVDPAVSEWMLRSGDRTIAVELSVDP